MFLIIPVWLAMGGSSHEDRNERVYFFLKKACQFYLYTLHRGEIAAILDPLLLGL